MRKEYNNQEIRDKEQLEITEQRLDEKLEKKGKGNGNVLDGRKKMSCSLFRYLRY